MEPGFRQASIHRHQNNSSTNTCILHVARRNACTRNAQCQTMMCPEVRDTLTLNRHGTATEHGRPQACPPAISSAPFLWQLVSLRIHASSAVLYVSGDQHGMFPIPSQTACSRGSFQRSRNHFQHLKATVLARENQSYSSVLSSGRVGVGDRGAVAAQGPGELRQHLQV